MGIRVTATVEDGGMRELDVRSGDGIEVRLLWEPRTDSVCVSVFDERTSDRFRIEVDASDALDAFRHPYAYATRGPRTIQAFLETRSARPARGAAAADPAR